MAKATKQLKDGLLSFDNDVRELSARYIVDDWLTGNVIHDSQHSSSNSTANNPDNNSEKDSLKKHESHQAGPGNKGKHDFLKSKLKNIHTLIVEDNKTDQLIIKHTAEKLSLDVKIAANGEEAITLLETQDDTHPFQLMIIDFKMPDLDGLTASRYIKEELGLKNPPKIILLSAYQRDEIFSFPNSYNCVNAFLTKPIDAEKLQDALADIVEHAELLEENWPATHKQTLNLPSNFSLTQEQKDALLSKCHLLVAEDNIINQRVAMGILKLKGIRVTIANNGQEAVDIIKSSPPKEFDAVLMDIDMPVLDGYQAATIIKNFVGCENLPILALTAHKSADDKEKCIESGMKEYLTKPIKPELLYDSIVNCITEVGSSNKDEE